ncbi:DNA-3-methyladenine glycosylase family protein [Ihubacter sp. rT4E-8]|uniref:DNA-3-methyladenine glycosylase family protein n=1 Tax=Ihubacter sp. rT4E-8 TaxID=3242369 RepID=UPI003CF30876
MPNVVTIDMSTPSVQYLCKKDKRLAKVISMVGSISYVPHEEDAYAFLVHEIIEQMLSVKAGQKIYSRLEELCGEEISSVRIAALTDEQIRSTGTSNAKVEYIRNITNAVTNGTLDFSAMQHLSDEEVIASLTKIRGIGKWTAKMYLMFVLDRQDILPFEDGAFLQVYRWMYKTQDCSEKAVTTKCKKWKPYSSVASRFCYRALDASMTKEEFHLFK